MKNRIAPMLGSLLLVLSGCGGGGSQPAPDTGPTPLAQKALISTADGELLDYFRARLALWLQQAQQGGTVMTLGGTSFSPDTASGAQVTPAPSPSPSGSAATSSAVNASTTTVQEAGVDEDDLVKTDGRFIYSMVSDGQASRLQVHRVLDKPPLEKLGGLALPQGAAPIGLLLAVDAQRIALLSSPQSQGARLAWFSPIFWYRSTTSVTVVDVGNPANPVATHTLDLDGGLVGSRLIGNTLYLATRWYPRLPVFDFSGVASAAVRNQLAIDSLAIGDVLPNISIDGGVPQPLLSEKDCLVQPGNGSQSLDVIAVTAIDLGNDAMSRNSRCFVGGSEAFYMSPDNIYLATTRYAYAGGGANWSYPATITTDIHKFAVSGLSIDYRGSGEVPGHLGWNAQSKSYRFGEFNGDLRVLTFTGASGWATTAPGTGGANPPPSPATLSILRESQQDKSLALIGQLPNGKRPEALGLPGQQIFATRFLGPRGYLVTYQSIDPLYVLDLSDPTDPKTLGSLQMPGYSDYLYPVGDAMLLGVGRSDGTWSTSGVRIALFDVADPAKPRQLASRVIGLGGSRSGLDFSPHSITFQTAGSLLRFALPVAEQGPYIINGLFLDNGLIQEALYRYEIDTRTGVLNDRPPIVAQRYSGPYDPALARYPLPTDRSVMIDAQVHYFSDGNFISSLW